MVCNYKSPLCHCHQISFPDFIQQNPKDGESSSSSNENETIAFYQFKKRRAEKKCELLDLQLKLMKEEHERKMAFMIEKHELEMKLLKSQLEFYQWKSSHKQIIWKYSKIGIHCLLNSNPYQ